jgi:hypothetical protein
MQTSGSGGFGAVSVGISEFLIGAVILVIVLLGIWKLVKLLWAAFSG